MNKIKLFSFFLIILAVVSVYYNIGHVTSNNIYLSELKSQFDNFLYKYNDFDDELPVLALRDKDHTEYSSLIPKDKAVEDVEYLFSLLKFGYAGYEYFGGDDIFIPAKENILWSVIALDGSNVLVRDFLNIMYSELSFIQDSHFTLGNYKLCNYTKYFSSRQFVFYKDDMGYYTHKDGELFYIESINDEKP